MHPRINMKKIIIPFGFSALRPEAAPIEATPFLPDLLLPWE
jgi:hypothetical protein